MQRGIRRKDIFTTGEDYQVCMTLIKKALERYGCTMYGYCLMTNHYHLLIGSCEEPIWKFMKMVAHQYAMYFNHSHGYCGHLFEGRYKAVIVESDTYFLQCSRYIHLNPVKARIVTNPQQYPWSSYRTLIGMEQDRMTHVMKTLRYFKNEEPKYYQNFVEDYNSKYIAEESCAIRIREEEELWLPW